jgi:MFS family permease
MYACQRYDQQTFSGDATGLPLQNVHDSGKVIVMASHAPSSSWRQGLTRNVVILGTVSFLNDAASEMIYPLLPVFLASVLGAGPAALGAIEGVAESTASLLKLYSGYLSDRMRRRKGWIVGGYTLSNVIRPLIAVAGSWFQVLVLRFIDRVGKGLRTSPRDAVIADATPPESRGAAYGFHRAMDHAGAIAGPLLATGLLLVFHDRISTVFLLSFIPGTLAVVILLAGLQEGERAVGSRSSARFNVRSAWAEMPGPFRQYLLIVLLFTLGNSSDAFLLMRAQELGVPVALLPTIWVVLHVVKMAISVPGGLLSDRTGRKRVIVAGWVVYALVYAGFAFASELWHAWALFPVYGVYFGLTEGVEKALVADLSPVPLRGSAFGLYHLAVGFTAFPASLLFGLLWQSVSPAAAFGFGAGLALLAGLLMSLLPVRGPGQA